MVRYVKCPRCELNYIDEEKQEYCDVCLAEMHGDRLQFADLDEEDLEAIDAELETELCSVCGVNPVRYGEKVCESCKQESSEYDEDEEIDIEKDEEWKNYLDEDDGDLTVDTETLDEELDGEFDSEESEDTYEEDDFFEEDLEPLADYDDDEDDLDDEEDEDDDDF